LPAAGPLYTVILTHPKNYGTKILTSATINYKINGVLQSPYLWTGNLSPDSTANALDVNISGLSGNNSVIAWTSNPNGFNDSFPQNDTGVIQIHIIPYPFGKAYYDTVCIGTIIKLGSSPKGGHTYSWFSKPPGFSSNISNPMDTAKFNETYFQKDYSISSGCGILDSFKITVVPDPFVKIQIDSSRAFERVFTAITPNYPEYMYKWRFGDSDSASGFSLKHIFKNNGNYKIILSVSSPDACAETDSITININEYFSLNIFPNPFLQKTDIKYTIISPAHVKISISDELGQQICAVADNLLLPGEYDTYFDAAKWKTRPAVYFVIFQIDDRVIVKKIVQLESVY